MISPIIYFSFRNIYARARPPYTSSRMEACYYFFSSFSFSDDRYFHGVNVVYNLSSF